MGPLDRACIIRPSRCAALFRGREGERLWKQDGSLHRLIPDLKTLVGMRPMELAGKIGQGKADALTGFGSP